MLVLERGGRIFGPFFGERPGVLWASRAWEDRKSFCDLLESGCWNVGGDRVWIAPEVQFHIQDRTDPANTEKIPGAVDPGSYRMILSENTCTLAQEMTLRAYNLATGTTKLRLQKRISPAANPLRAVSNYEELMDGVVYGGYLQELTLSRRDNSGIAAEAWNITQINPSGELMIPSTQKAEFVNYYEPVDEYLQRYDQYARLIISGDRRYKVGFKAAHIKGDMAYIYETDHFAYLYIKHFFNNPSAAYAEEPAHLPGNSGCSIHVYNDSGEMGGFAEMECNLQPIGGAVGRESSTDTICNWFYIGRKSQLKKILTSLLGLNGDE